jgi:osmotically-inducible protein OsmY
MNKHITLASILLSVTILQGCVAAAVVGLAGTASVVNDRRTVGSQIDDQTIEVKAAAYIADSPTLKKHAHIQVVSLNGSVLVVGQIPDSQQKSALISAIGKIQGVVQVHDQLRIQKPNSLSDRSHDVWLTSKIKAQLLASDKVDGTAIKVVTENSEVFLMGLVSTKEANVAVEIARNVTGVNKVFKAFEPRKN